MLKNILKPRKRRPRKPSMREVAVFFSEQELDKLIGSLEVQEDAANDDDDPELNKQYAALKEKLIEARNQI